jgi:hypothetical protein
MGLGLLFRADHGGVREDGIVSRMGGDVGEGYSTWLAGYVVSDVVSAFGSDVGEEDESPICVVPRIG